MTCQPVRQRMNASVSIAGLIWVSRQALRVSLTNTFFATVAIPESRRTGLIFVSSVIPAGRMTATPTKKSNGGIHSTTDTSKLPMTKKARKKDNENMILAIDPGTEQSGYVFFDANEKCVISKGIIPNNEMIHIIHESLDITVAIEMIASYGMAVGKDTFETCLWIGRYVQTAINNDLPLHLVYRKDVKMYLCNSMKAKDTNIRQALIDLLGKDVTKGISKHMWAALAIAVTVSRS